MTEGPHQFAEVNKKTKVTKETDAIHLTLTLYNQRQPNDNNYLSFQM